LVCIACNLEGPQCEYFDDALDAFEDMPASECFEACGCGEYPEVVAVAYTARCGCGARGWTSPTAAHAAIAWNDDALERGQK
jgi:hypothetical protein